MCGPNLTAGMQESAHGNSKSTASEPNCGHHRACWPKCSTHNFIGLGAKMTDAYIYDHVRTPRGRGKSDGSLHEVSTLNLASTALAALRDRNELDAGMIDDVVLGCVDPVGEAGGDIARVAALNAGYGNSVPGMQINRFCASGLDAVNFAAAQI